jgi:hypothetical protein
MIWVTSKEGTPTCGLLARCGNTAATLWQPLRSDSPASAGFFFGLPYAPRISPSSSERTLGSASTLLATS